MKINLFPSYKFKKNAPFLNAFMSENPDLTLTTSGTAALCQILLTQKIDLLFVPQYICSTIDRAIFSAKVKVIYFEIDPQTLQPSLPSLIQQFEQVTQTNHMAVLWPTYFGYTQDLEKVMLWCEQQKIFFINDLAQSFGCSWKGTPLHTLGDAMFFSFSPGKPTTAHLGGILKSPIKNQLNSGSSLYNFFIYFIFYIHRYLNFPIPGIVRKLYFLLFNKYYLMNQSISSFDQGVLGGVLERESKWQLKKQRQIQFQELSAIIAKNPSFKIPYIENLEESNPYKFVFMIKDQHIFKKVRQYLKNHQVQYGTFYKPRPVDLSVCKINNFTMNEIIIELPILEESLQHEQLKKILSLIPQ